MGAMQWKKCQRDNYVRKGLAQWRKGADVKARFLLDFFIKFAFFFAPLRLKKGILKLEYLPTWKLVHFQIISFSNFQIINFLYL